jgi:transposase
MRLLLWEGIGMQAYSQDLRDRVLRAVARGERPTEIAKRFEVSRVWVYQVAQRYRSSGERSSLRVGGYRRSRVAPLEATVRGWIKAEPDLTLAELCERIAARGIQIKAPALWHQLNNWGLSFKKNPARQRARARRRAAGAA